MIFEEMLRLCRTEAAISNQKNMILYYNIMSLSYHLRASNHLDEVLTFVKLNSARSLICREEADAEVNRTHIHCHIYIATAKQSFRNKFLKYIKDLKLEFQKGDYSFEEVRDEKGMDNYLCKGISIEEDPILIHKYGIYYTSEYLKQCHIDYWEINKSLKKKKRKENLTVMEEAVKVCRERSLRWDDRDSITEVWLERLKANQKGVDVNQCRRNIRGIMLLLCPDDKYKKHFTEVIWY